MLQYDLNLQPSSTTSHSWEKFPMVSQEFFLFLPILIFYHSRFLRHMKSIIQSNTSSLWVKEKGAVLNDIAIPTPGYDFLLRTLKNPLMQAFKARKMINMVERFLPEAAEDKVFNLGSSSQSYLNYTCIISGFSHGQESRSLKPAIHQARNAPCCGRHGAQLHPEYAN